MSISDETTFRLRVKALNRCSPTVLAFLIETLQLIFVSFLEGSFTSLVCLAATGRREGHVVT